MMLKFGEKTKDYATIWNEATAGICMVVSFSVIGSFISYYQSCSEMKAIYSSSIYAQQINCGVLFESFDSALMALMAIVMFVAGLSNFFYTRRYFRDGNLKTASGFIATITLVASNLYLVYSQIRSLIESSGSRLASVSSLISSYSWMTWVALIALIVSLIMSVIAMINVFTWSPITIDSEEDGEKETPEIAAYAATRAMGHAAPKVPEEKKLPPLLNTDPDVPVAQPANAVKHEIITDMPPVSVQGAGEAPSGTPVSAASNQASTPVSTVPNQASMPGQYHKS